MELDASEFHCVATSNPVEMMFELVTITDLLKVIAAWYSRIALPKSDSRPAIAYIWICGNADQTEFGRIILLRELIVIRIIEPIVAGAHLVDNFWTEITGVCDIRQPVIEII